MAKLEFIDVDILPLCPHCEKELDTIERIHKGFFTSTMIYVCPHCKKIISIGYEH